MCYQLVRLWGWLCVEMDVIDLEGVNCVSLYNIGFEFVCDPLKGCMCWFNCNSLK